MARIIQLKAQQSVMKSRNKLSEHLIHYPFQYGASAIFLLLLAFLLNFRKADISREMAEWGQFGDYLGGILNPIFGLISVVLVAATLRSQTQSAAKQGFEEQFFNLLNLHESVLQSIDKIMKGGQVKRGRDCFQLFYKKIVTISQTENVSMTTAYQRFLEDEGWEIEHYFRTVYHLFKYVKDSHSSTGSEESEKKRYYDLIKSQLSQYELVLLWFNVQSINRGNWESILNDPYAKPFEHLNKAHLIENPPKNMTNDLAP